MSTFNPKKSLRKDKMPLVLAGAGLAALIIFFLMLFPKDQQSTENEGFSATDMRFNLLEERIIRLEERIEKSAEPGGQPAEIGAPENFASQLGNLETSLSARMDEMAKQLDRLQRDIARSGQKHAASSPSPRVPAKKETAEKKNAPAKKSLPSQYHQVRAGETLYYISNRYGLTLEKLRQLNGLAPGSPIHPGQRLIVGPVK
jgi:hypothetical protein